ncbi:hypothetical protein JL722_3111 [Aureococcus anophagefferens]|nr:hypothetical protein JL722_3111 [Aureococcus anophagefferens]
MLSPSTLPLAAPLTTRDGATATVALRAGYEIEDVEKLLDGGGDLPAELASSLRSDLIALGRDVDADDLRNVGALQDALRPRDGETKETSAARALPHARRAAELGALPRRRDQRCEPDDALQRRWRRADDAAAAAAKDRDVAAAEARATRAGDLEHAALVAAAARKLADLAAAKLERDLAGDARRATRGAAAHDETVRFLADLRDKAGVDTGDVLTAPAKEEPPLESRVEALLATALLKARA